MTKNDTVVDRVAASSRDFASARRAAMSAFSAPSAPVTRAKLAADRVARSPGVGDGPSRRMRSIPGSANSVRQLSMALPIAVTLAMSPGSPPARPVSRRVTSAASARACV